MATIIIQLDPTQLTNPDLDMRYKLPDLLVQRSGGRLSSDGYDYVGEGKCLHLFLETEDVSRDLPVIIDVLKSERLLGNELSAVPLAVEDGDHFHVVYPPGFVGTFLQSGGG